MKILKSQRLKLYAKNRYQLQWEDYEILKIKNTVINKSSENYEEPYKPLIDTIIRSLEKLTLNLPVTSQLTPILYELWGHQRLQSQFSSARMIELVCDFVGFFIVFYELF